MYWKGHLWQERFHSFVMDERHLLAAVRYVELNPVRAKFCASAFDWPWSSAAAYLAGRDDALAAVGPMLKRIENWEEYLSRPAAGVVDSDLRKHSRSGRPAGDNAFLDALEAINRRRLKKRKPGPRPRGHAN